MSATSRLALAFFSFLVSCEGIRRGLALPAQQGRKLLAVLLRNGGPASPHRLPSILNTWGSDLEEGSLILLESDESCENKYGDNHWVGLTCLEAKSHMRLMNRTDFDWLLVVDDDTYVFADRLRDTLRQMDTSKAEVYGAPYCGDCGNGRKGFCGGGGYVIAHQQLLRLASSTAAPVSSDSGGAFLNRMMSQPNEQWCDVRFGCVAQEMGLKAVGVKGLYGNGIVDAHGEFDAQEETRVVELTSQAYHDPPLVFHNVKDAEHMRRIHEEYLQEKTQDTTQYYSAEGITKWAWEEPAKKAAALTTVLTGIGKDARRLFASIGLSMPDATVFVACTSSMVEKLGAEFPQLNFRTVPILDEYEGMSRAEMTAKGLWVSFNGKRIDILKQALSEGHDGAWYMDGDTFLVDALPRVDVGVGLSRHRIDSGMEHTFGEWNSGYIFFRSSEALNTWERATQAMNQSSSTHQITLRQVAQKHSSEMVELGCGINVGGFRMDPLLSVDFKPHYSDVHCSNGAVQYQDCSIISGHWHAADTNGRAVRPYMEKALRDCNHPLLTAWLASY